MDSEINGNFRKSYGAVVGADSISARKSHGAVVGADSISARKSHGMVVGADSISARKYITNPLFNKRKILQTFCYAKREFISLPQRGKVPPDS